MMKSTLHDRTPTTDPIPEGAEGQVQWTHRLVRRHPIPKSELAAAAKLSPPDRIARLYPLGVRVGAFETMNAAAAMPPRRGGRKPLDIGEADMWAAGLGVGLTLPPRAMLRDRTIEATCRKIYYAGVRAGALKCLEWLGWR